MSDLKAFKNALRKFAAIDPQMQVLTVLTLLEVQEAIEKGQPNSIGDIAQRVGMINATASRNCSYWTEHGSKFNKRTALLLSTADPANRTRVTHSMTHVGTAFFHALQEDLNG